MRTLTGLCAAVLLSASATIAQGPVKTTFRPINYAPSIDKKHDKLDRKAQRPRWRR